jgi:cytochrome c peroxidase
MPDQRHWDAAVLVLTIVCGTAGLFGCGGSARTTTPASNVNQKIRQVARAHGLSPFPTLAEPNRSSEQREIRELRRELGRNLFFDHILSGVEQTSCGTCHHAAFQFGDGRNIARGVFCDLATTAEQIFCRAEPPPPGEGGNVVGPDRTSPLNSRNSPLVINAALFPKQMWNGRFHFVDDSSTDVNQCDASLGFEFPPPERVLLVRSILTGQAHIPVTEAVEMTGDFPEFGEPFEEPSHRNPEVREAIANRVSDTPAYHTLFEEAYPKGRPEVKLFSGDPEVGPDDDIPYLAIGDALGHFMETLVMTDAPWDHFLAGDDTAINDAAKRGALLFFKDGQCVSCHSGNLFSDFENYNIGVPQVGPGTAQFDTDASYRGLRTWDFGLEEINFQRRDRFKFRTPPLRGVALSSPYMHNGCYRTLEDAIRHHTDPEAAYANYDISQIEQDMQDADGLKPMGPVFERRNPVALGSGAGQTRIDLTDSQIDDLVEFLKALTDARMQDTASMAPSTVPSGLPVDVPGPRRFPLYE